MELTTAVSTRLRVPSLPDPATEQLLASELLPELHHAVGGPFHVVLPAAFDENLAALRAVLDEEAGGGRVVYAKKANKAAAFVQRCAAGGIGVDVASTGEFADSLAHGVPGGDLVVTGPVKSRELLHLAAYHGATVTIDDPSELAALVAVAPRVAVPVLFRHRPSSRPESRFGMAGASLRTALGLAVEHADAVSLVGFSAHLSGYSIGERATVALDLIELCGEARELGLRPHTVDIGGGLPVRYTDADSWQHFLDANTPEHFHAGHDFADYYPYYSVSAGAEALRQVLRSRPADRSVADLLAEAGLTLMIEPGRALLDRAGFTVFGVQGVTGRGDHDLLTVDGTSLSLSEQWFASEFVPDPVLLPRRRTQDGRRAASVGAATCLESDMLTWRKIVFDQPPAPGDLLAYLNTAGYQMDSNESAFHHLPIPPKIVIEAVEPGARPRWRFDRHPGATS